MWRWAKIKVRTSVNSLLQCSRTYIEKLKGTKVEGTKETLRKKMNRIGDWLYVSV